MLTANASGEGWKLGTGRQKSNSVILTSYLPAAPGSSMDRLLDALASVPDALPFVGPDQAALEQTLAGITGPVG
jgi:hypothetical protein